MEEKDKSSFHDSRFTIHEAQLPKEMREHTYEIMNRVEDSHWWFVGRRAILESFLEEIAEGLGQVTGDRRRKTGDGRQETGTGDLEEPLSAHHSSPPEPAPSH